MKKRKILGFTLIELLVVISIIGVLSAVGLASFSGAQRRARDGRRRADIKSYQEAMEQYYVDNGGQYNANCGTMLSGYYAGPWPSDPLNTGSYQYGSYMSCDADSYCVCALLENPGTGNGNGVGASATCNFAVNGNYYCLQSRQ